MQNLKPLAWAVLLGLSASPLADDSAFSFSGFGTVGVVRSNTDDAQYRNNFRQPDGADKSASLKVDSKLGLQLSGKLSPAFSLTAQLLAQQNDEDKFTPELEWAFGKYAVTSDLSLRLGRIGMPVFLISDFRNVGYANTWVRPPVEVYAQVPLATFDGVDFVWSKAIGDNTLTLQPYAGSTKFDLVGNLKGKGKRLMGVNATYEVGSLLLRAGYVKTRFYLEGADTARLFGGMRQVGAVLPGWTAAANDMEAKDKAASFAGIGATWDDGKLVLQGEYTQRRTKTYVEDTDAWYGTAGYRFGNLTPYISYATTKTKHNDVADRLFAPPPQASCAVAPTQPICIKGAAMSAMSGADQHTTSLGVRWNAYKNIALKAQFDRVRADAGKDNWFNTPVGKPGVAGKSVNVYSLAADFIF
ncbi:porin [Chitinimonas arctica]|nr:porin [Chitinimonas arctica]